MNNLFRILFITALSCLLLPVQVQAQESADTVDVVATGFGTTVEAATRNASRAAVEQVVGSMVFAESLVESGELVQDRILGFSAGYIESHEVLGEPRQTDDGLWSVRIRATVKRRALGEELRRTGVNRVFFDGASLAMRENQRVDNQDAAIDLMQWRVDNLHISAMSTTLLSRDYDRNTNQLTFEIETRMRLVRQWSK